MRFIMLAQKTPLHMNGGNGQTVLNGRWNGSNRQQNNSGWGVKMFFIGIIAAFFIIIGVGYPLCAAIIYPIYRALGGKQSFFDYMKDI